MTDNENDSSSADSSQQGMKRSRLEKLTPEEFKRITRQVKECLEIERELNRSREAGEKSSDEQPPSSE